MATAENFYLQFMTFCSILAAFSQLFIHILDVST